MQTVKPRKPLLALLMSLVLPGFGQIYNGEVNKGVWLIIGLAFVSVPGLAFLALYVPGRLMIVMLLAAVLAALAIWVYAMADAWHQSKRKQDYVPERWQTSGFYALVLIAGNLVALPVLGGYVRAHFVESFRIPSTSMEPSVLRGDFLFADKRYNCRGCKGRIARGDIAVFTYPNDRTQLNIKRIIALPGDHVRIEGRTVEVNERELGPPGVDAVAGDITETSADGREWRVQWEELAGDPVIDLVVPPGEVFVLGDNRSFSRDSRHVGTVPMQDVVGRARQVWFSRGPDGIRWGRLGKTLE